MSETQAEYRVEPAAAPPPRPNPKFTIPARRLRGSVECQNCGTALQGPFCHYCGQPDRHFLRFFPVLLRELAADFLDLDSRFMRTLRPLLFHPGRLTRDYLGGRRFRYTPPLRLYLFASIAFFLCATLMSAGVLSFEDGDGPVVIHAPGEPMDEATREQVEEALKVVPGGVAEEVRAELDAEASARAEEAQADADPDGGEGGDEESGLQMDQIRFNDQPWDRENNPLVIPFVPGRLNDWINDEIAESPRKTEAIRANPDLIVEEVFDLLPGTMFVLLPVVALIFKFWYLFARRYYIEHLVFALHNHAFIFVALLLALLASQAGDALTARGFEGLARVPGWLSVALFCWIPIYLLVSLKVVYRQGWFLTLAKYGLIGISYVMLLGAVTTFVALLGFLLL